MGIVYRAEQEKPRRVVALKIIRADIANERILRRFEDEAQTLGRLHHPGIAQIYEAGTTDAGHGAQPWFAMELIEGQSLTSYMVEHGLGTRSRLELMAGVCDAVHHAHQKGVIHRDLKPGNILVDRTGQPKIVDFGVARVTDADIRATTIQTDVGQLLGTLPYMSPEQVMADPAQLDTRSDVYALGVILYELLCARLPYDVRQKGVAEAARIIGEQEPAMLSMYSRVFRGDIETIVAKALEKDKERRYASASELGEDIRRYLKNEPIVARPAGTLYQFRKFANRHRAFVTATVVVFISLVLGIAGISVALVQAHDARRQALAEREIAEEQKNIAEGEARRADDTYRFLENLLVSADPSVNLGEDLTVREVLDRSAEKIETEMAGQPETEGAVRRTIGNTYHALGLYDQAVNHLRRAVDICAAPADPETCYGRRSDLARSLISLGSFDEAEELLRDSIAEIKAESGSESELLSSHLIGLADVLHGKGRYDEAEAPATHAVALMKKHGDSPLRLGQALTTLASVRSARGDWDGAELLYREALPLVREEYGEVHPQVCVAMSNIASMHEKRGQYDESAPLMQQVLDLRRQMLPPKHPDIAIICNNLAFSRRMQNRLDDSEALYREALDIYEEQFGEDHIRVAVVLNNLAGLLKDKADHDAAIEMYERVLTTLRNKFGSEHPHVASTLNNIATVHHMRHDYASAEAVLREALDLQKRLLGEDHPTVATCSYNLAGALRHQQKLREAEPLFRQSLKIRKSVLGDDHRLTLIATCGLANLLRDAKRYDEAATIYLDTIRRFEDTTEPDDEDITESLLGYGRLLMLTDRLTEADAFASRAVTLREQALSPEHWYTHQARALLGKIRFRMGDHQTAETLLRDALGTLENEFGANDMGNREILDYLARLCEHGGRTEEAEAYRAKLQRITLEKDN